MSNTDSPQNTDTWKTCYAQKEQIFTHSSSSYVLNWDPCITETLHYVHFGEIWKITFVFETESWRTNGYYRIEIFWAELLQETTSLTGCLLNSEMSVVANLESKQAVWPWLHLLTLHVYFLPGPCWFKWWEPAALHCLQLWCFLAIVGPALGWLVG